MICVSVLQTPNPTRICEDGDDGKCEVSPSPSLPPPASFPSPLLLLPSLLLVCLTTVLQKQRAIKTYALCYNTTAHSTPGQADPHPGQARRQEGELQARSRPGKTQPRRRLGLLQLLQRGCPRIREPKRDGLMIGRKERAERDGGGGSARRSLALSLCGDWSESTPGASAAELACSQPGSASQQERAAAGPRKAPEPGG